jgi:hypothetical protein
MSKNNKTKVAVDGTSWCIYCNGSEPWPSCPYCRGTNKVGSEPTTVIVEVAPTTSSSFNARSGTVRTLRLV